MDFDHQPMHKARQALALHPRCGAKCRTGKPCKNASMKNGRCRMHGGKSTGAPIKHGQRTKAAVAQRSSDRVLIKTLRAFACIDDRGTIWTRTTSRVQPSSTRKHKVR